MESKTYRLVYFDTTCVEVALPTSAQVAEKWFLTSAQVGQKLDFGLPTNLVGGHFLFPTTCREVGFQNSVQLGQNYFFEFFLEMLLKMPFSSATTGRDFFCAHSPKRQSHRLPLGRNFWIIAAEARIKNLLSAATIWEGLWTKCRSHRLSLEKKFSVLGANVNVFSGGIWRLFSKTRW